MKTVDLIIFVVYLVGMVLFGISFYRKERTTDEYSTGGGTLPTWVIGLSIFATFVSSISYLALPGAAYLTNWNAYAFSLSIPLAIWMAIRFFIPLYRSVGSPSAYTYLEQRFGPWARLYVASFWLLTQVMRVAVILYLLALPMYVILGWDMRLIIALTGVSVLFYSIMGGIRAVIWTDAIQALVLIAGALVAVGVLVFSLPGGPAQFVEVASRHNKFSMGSLGLSLTESTFWTVFVYGLFINLQNYGVDQNYIQRYMTARNDREATRSAFGGGLLYIPVSLLFFVIGTGLFVYFDVFPGALPAEFREAGMADSVFPYFIVNVLPTGLTGLLVASIFSAGMSTISTSLNSGATVILFDFYRRFRDGVGERESVRVLYVASAVIAGLGIGIAFLMIQAKSALDVWWKLAGIFSGGMLGLFLLGYFSRRAGNAEAAVAVVVGVFVIAWMSLPDLFPFGVSLHSYFTVVFGTSAIFLTGFLLARLRRPRAPLPERDADPERPEVLERT